MQEIETSQYIPFPFHDDSCYCFDAFLFLIYQGITPLTDLCKQVKGKQRIQ